MMLLVKFALLLTLGSVLTLTNGTEIPVLKRTVRSVLNSRLANIMSSIQSEIISNCKENGEELQKIYSELVPCIGRYTFGATPKQIVLNNIEQCSKVAVAKTKECLKDYQKYFPDFVLSLIKSEIEMMYYDDYYIVHGEFALCVPKILAPEAERNYIKCVTDISERDNDTEFIAPKPQFCKYFIETSYCFTNLIEKECGHSKDLDKYRQDYINASKKPCDM